MKRLWLAFLNSMRALRYLLGTEKAVQQEAALLVASLPLSWLIAGSVTQQMLLVGSVLFLLIVEVLNTGIEAACNAVTREFNADIRIAKDCGSLAVLLTSLGVAVIWLTVIIMNFAAG